MPAAATGGEFVLTSRAYEDSDALVVYVHA
jgi:hypothetical protein